MRSIAHILKYALTSAIALLLLAGCVVADGPPDEVLRPDLLAEAFGNRMVRTNGSTVVIDNIAFEK